MGSRSVFALVKVNTREKALHQFHEHSGVRFLSRGSRSGRIRSLETALVVLTMSRVLGTLAQAVQCRFWLQQ